MVFDVGRDPKDRPPLQAVSIGRPGPDRIEDRIALHYPMQFDGFGYRGPVSQGGDPCLDAVPGCLTGMVPVAGVDPTPVGGQVVRIEHAGLRKGIPDPVINTYGDSGSFRIPGTNCHVVEVGCGCTVGSIELTITEDEAPFIGREGYLDPLAAGDEIAVKEELCTMVIRPSEIEIRTLPGRSFEIGRIGTRGRPDFPPVENSGRSIFEGFVSVDVESQFGGMCVDGPGEGRGYHTVVHMVVEGKIGEQTAVVIDDPTARVVAPGDARHAFGARHDRSIVHEIHLVRRVRAAGVEIPEIVAQVGEVADPGNCARNPVKGTAGLEIIKGG